jgi:Protein of unknown function (DUF3352)
MRPLLALVLALPVLAAAGCGGDDSSGALDEALRYLPEDAPLVAAIDTDIEGDQYEAAGRLARKFPFGGRAIESLERQLERGGVDFDEDVKPLLGNPFVVGAVDARSFTDDEGDREFVGATRVKDGGKLEELIEKGNTEERGEKSGAKLYEDDDGDAFAVKDDVLVVANSRQVLEEALERRDGDASMREDEFNEGLEGLPDEALVRVYSDIQGLLEASPEAREARKVKWVSSLRTFGLTAAAADDGVEIEFDLRTSPDGLTSEDLPIAAGKESPEIVKRDGELGLGLRDPGQVIDFAVAAGTAVQGGSVEAGKRQLERQLGIDLERDVIAQLSGDASVNVAPNGQVGVRAEVEDPTAFERTLDRVEDRLPRVLERFGRGPAKVERARGDDRFSVLSVDDEEIVFGVVGEALIVSTDLDRASRLTTESPSTVPGASGAGVLNADAEKLADAILDRLTPQLGLGAAFGSALFTAPLGDLTGSVESGTGGLRGRLKLEIR